MTGVPMEKPGSFPERAKLVNPVIGHEFEVFLKDIYRISGSVGAATPLLHDISVPVMEAVLLRSFKVNGDRKIPIQLSVDGELLYSGTPDRPEIELEPPSSERINCLFRAAKDGKFVGYFLPNSSMISVTSVQDAGEMEIELSLGLYGAPTMELGGSKTPFRLVADTWERHGSGAFSVNDSKTLLRLHVPCRTVHRDDEFCSGCADECVKALKAGKKLLKGKS